MTDITYIRTHEGFAYLAVVLDLYSRRVIGWSIQGRQTTDVVLQALLMAVWRRKPKAKVLIHSDQGSRCSTIRRASTRETGCCRPSSLSGSAKRQPRASRKLGAIQINFSRPGKLTDNAFIETFNGSLRDECLNIHWFETIAEAQRLIEAWRIDYNESRPHMALGHIPPNEYAWPAVSSTGPTGSNAVES